VDYLAANGRWLGNGPGPPVNTAYIRRWAVVFHGSDPVDTLLLSAVVLPIAERTNTNRAQTMRLDTLLTRVTR
jgi:hypothetical protein